MGMIIRTSTIPRTVSEFNNSRIEKYSDICSKVALKYGTRFVPLYENILSFSDWKTFFVDGIHLAHKGNAYVFSALQTHVDDLTAEDRVFLPVDEALWD